MWHQKFHQLFYASSGAAALAVILNPKSTITISLCIVAITFWFVNIVSWAGSIESEKYSPAKRHKPNPMLKKVVHLLVFLMSYASLVFLFSLLYFSIVSSGSEILCNNGEFIQDYTNCLYFSAVTATTLGYGDLVPFDSPTKWSAVAEGSLGINFLVSVIAVVLSR